MARFTYQSKSMLRSPRLTPEELAALQEVANRPMQRTISDDHRERLLKAGYIREVVDTHGGVSALALTDVIETARNNQQIIPQPNDTSPRPSVQIAAQPQISASRSGAR